MKEGFMKCEHKALMKWVQSLGNKFKFGGFL